VADAIIISEVEGLSSPRNTCNHGNISSEQRSLFFSRLLPEIACQAMEYKSFHWEKEIQKLPQGVRIIIRSRYSTSA
jgi:hypothetical protein